MKRTNEVLVGTLVLVSLTFLAVGATWLAHGGLSRGYPLYTRFAWGENLKEGQPVQLAGVAVGSVSAVELGNGYLDVKLSINKNRHIPIKSLATVKPVGIFGDVVIALTPPLPIPTESYKSGDTVPAGPPIPDISDVIARVDTISESVVRLETAIETDFVKAGGIKDLRKAAASVVALSEEMQRDIGTQNANLTSTMTSVRQSAEQIGDAAKRVASFVDSAAIDSTVKNLNATTASVRRLAASFDTTARQFRDIVTQINSGSGSAGLFIRDPRLYNSSVDAVRQLQEVLSDLEKHPKKYLTFSIFGGGGG